MSTLFDQVEGKRDELIELTQELVRIPTVNPPGDAYTPCSEMIGERLRRRGFQVEYIRALGAFSDSEAYPRTNVVARFEGKRPGPTVHFNSHIDVVEAGQGWTVDPFNPVVKDGRIYGRGTCDMKGGLAASIVAVESLLEIDSEFPGCIEISGTVDEESGGFGGVAYLAEKGLFSKPRVDHVIIPEPLNKDRICLGHRGVWWAEIETIGKIAHGSMPFLGNCAIRHMGAVLEQFEKKLFPLLESKKTEMAVVPDGAKRSTINFNSIHGGQIEPEDFLPSPCVSDSCRIIIDRRFLIEENISEVKGEIEELLDELKENRQDFNYKLREIMEVLPTMTDKDAPVVNAVSGGIEKVLQKAPELIISPGSYDQKHIARIGHLHDCIAYGPGILDLAHQPDEFIVIEDMVESAKIMAFAAQNLLYGKV